MAFAVQNDTGTTLNANAYIDVTTFKAYHDDRGNSYAALSDPQIQQRIIKATDFIDHSRRWHGYKLSDGRVFASGLLAFAGPPANNDIVTIGSRTYTYKTALTPAANEVLIGASATTARDNLVAAITAGAGSGTLYGAGTLVHADVTAAASGADMSVTSRYFGLGGNGVATTEASASLSFGAATLTGGIGQNTEFPRAELYDMDGNLVEGVPQEIKDACAEYALRADLWVDAPAPVGGVGIKRERVKLDVLETETEYSGSAATPVRTYAVVPAADILIKRSGFAISTGGRVARA